MEVSELCQSDPYGWPNSDAFARMLREFGVNICDRWTPIERGTPVFVEAGADPIEVQMAMARQHVSLLFVLEGDRVRGVIEMADLIRRGESITWAKRLKTSSISK